VNKDSSHPCCEIKIAYSTLDKLMMNTRKGLYIATKETQKKTNTWTFPESKNTTTNNTFSVVPSSSLVLLLSAFITQEKEVRILGTHSSTEVSYFKGRQDGAIDCT
jgi:hypothetical protein